MPAKTAHRQTRSVPWGRYNDDVNKQLAAHAGDTRQFATAHPMAERNADEGVWESAGNRRRANAPKPTIGITEPQRRYIGLLMDWISRARPDVFISADPWVQQMIDGWDIAMASKVIDRLKHHLGLNEGQTPIPIPGREFSANPEGTLAVREEVPVISGTAAVKDAFADVPDGYYALERDGGQPAFYRVSTMKPTARYPKAGRWVQQQVSDSLAKMFPNQRTAVMAEIRAVGPKVSAELYARLIGRCYVCGRTLTDAASRAKGIGPVCETKSSF